MSTIENIIKFNSGYLSEVLVKVDRSHGWVDIKDMKGIQDNIFLQGDEAYNFIDEADKLYNSLNDVTMDEVYLHLCKPYVECFWS